MAPAPERQTAANSRFFALGRLFQAILSHVMSRREIMCKRARSAVFDVSKIR
jgi:hypothetical protein